ILRGPAGPPLFPYTTLFRSGTGIGGGILFDGTLLRGAHNGAGEIGHMVVLIDGPRCGCGRRGCIEALASRTAIERDILGELRGGDRKSTRLNSSHVKISYAV